MPVRGRPRPSLRSLILVSTFLFGLLVVALLIGQTWTSRLLWQYALTLGHDAASVGIISELERALREDHRLENLLLARHDPAVATMQSVTESDLRRLIGEVEASVDNPVEDRLIDRVQRDVDVYLVERGGLEARGAGLEEGIVATRQSMERALAAIVDLRVHNEQELRQTQRDAQRVLWYETLVSGAGVGVLILALGAVVVGSRRLVLGPLLDLQEAVRQFRGGDLEVKARGGQVSELQDLASAFDEMAGTIALQRRNQLTFLAGVAHDLRDPVAAVKIGIQGLARAPPAATPEMLERLDRQLNRLARMVADLLDATRIEAGQLEIRPVDIDLREVVRAMVDLAPTTGNHAITTRLPDRPVMVRADALRMEQVVNNLLSNAIKYSPGGGPVEVALITEAGQAVIAVSDRGVGIASEDLTGLFDPFRRRPETREGIPGVGLGLSIVRRIVAAHGGQVEVESTVGVGSTFRVCLPLVAAAGTAADAQFESEAQR
jgi:two-component system, OmpR family, sensor histidine kinase MtrB